MRQVSFTSRNKDTYIITLVIWYSLKLNIFWEYSMHRNVMWTYSCLELNELYTTLYLLRRWYIKAKTLISINKEHVLYYKTVSNEPLHSCTWGEVPLFHSSLDNIQPQYYTWSMLLGHETMPVACNKQIWFIIHFTLSLKTRRFILHVQYQFFYLFTFKF